MDNGDRADREQYRDELRLFAYLMSGSIKESEWIAEYVLDSAAGVSDPGRSPLSLLYGQAVAACVGRLEGRPRRSLPSLVVPPSDPELPPGAVTDAQVWLEPFPDDLFPDSLKAPDPSREYGSRECISLYMAAALQDIDPRGRAAFIMSDLLGWSSDLPGLFPDVEERELLTLLDGAREKMTHSYKRDLGRRSPPPDQDATTMSMRYLYPWETADIDGLAERLAEDVVFQNPPSPSWYHGRDAFERFARKNLFPEGSPGRWRLLPSRAGGQLAFGTYHVEKNRRLYVAHSIQVLFFDEGLVSEIVCFEDADLFQLMGLLPEVVVQGSI
jgi:RNA polymerase sigma-70 factor (ECF subfamily)